ncbi:MAG: hypothetical protein K1X54_12100 [Flavobacteriales bacterium]|nr:hypothetical protein [Flavobacteriales bacterium]
MNLIFQTQYIIRVQSIAIQLTLLSLVFTCLNSCGRQSQHGNANQVVDQPNTQTNHNSFSTAISIDKNIRCIFQDKRSHYWIGTNGAGVYRYDYKTLTHYTVKDGLADNQVISIQEDDLGNIWFGAGSFRISKFDGTKLTMYTDQVHTTRGTEAEWNSEINDLWFYAGGGVIRYNHTGLTYLPFDESHSNPLTISPFALSRFGVYSILKDKSGNIWFGTQAEGVCKFDGKKLTWFKEKGLAGPAVLGLFEDSKGNLWFGNNGAGLFKYDGKTLTNFTDEKRLNNADFRVSGKSGLGTMARVYAINEDNNGNIWVGTVDAGVWKYDGTKLTNYTTKDGLTSNAVNTIFKDKNGELWFGTDSHGICKFNGSSFFEFSM